MAIDGMKELLRDLDRIEKEFPKEANKLTNKVGNVLKGEVKAITPVDTGELRSSIVFRTTGTYEVTVGTSKEYAPHVNYGHKTMKGKGKKSSRLNSVFAVSGQYFLEKGIENFEKNNLKPLLEHCIEKVIK